MRKQVILCLRVAWTVAALIILIMETSVCGSNDQACRPAGDTMLFLMGVLSFPGGLVCILVSLIACGLMGGEYPSGYFMAWFVMACGGCLQWYIIVPLLLEEPKFTFLNLNSKLAPKSVEPVVVKSTLPIETSPPITPPVIQLPRKAPARKRHNRVLAFDKLGRTPLERVISG